MLQSIINLVQELFEEISRYWIRAGATWLLKIILM